MLTAIVLTAAFQGGLNFVPEGMTAKMGGYMPIRAAMSATPPRAVKAAPPLSAPLYGAFTFGAQSFGFILDEPDGKPSILYVDTNGNGDYTDDAKAQWTAGQNNMFRGTAKVKLHGVDASLGVYRFDKNDPQRAALKTTLLYYTDFGYEGMLNFGGKDLKVAFAGEIEDGMRLWVDRNGNGKSDGRSESISTKAPFNFGGTTFELKVSDGSLKVQESSQKVVEIPLPPDLSVGQPAPKFEAVGMDGKNIQFPESFKGKIVMLDFWATWCGPCIAELPNVIKAYEKYHDKGFEVLGITLDDKDMADKVKAFTAEHKMPWAQIYEGKGWDITIGRTYGVEAIPFCLLVDGDTGKIIETVRALRGDALDQTLSKVLATR